MPDHTYVRCIVVERETEVPGLALIQLHDDLPPVHYVPLEDLVVLSEAIIKTQLLDLARSAPFDAIRFLEDNA